jgi:DNA-binding Lrp family transcriptional regulator
VSERPFAPLADSLGILEESLVTRISRLLDDGKLSRFGPLYNVERMGGAFCLCALTAPRERFDDIADVVNAHPEVAHNYEREHELNMWFVLATETPEGVERVAEEIERETGCEVLRFPKLQEYFVGLKLEA